MSNFLHLSYRDEFERVGRQRHANANPNHHCMISFLLALLQGWQSKQLRRLCEFANSPCEFAVSPGGPGSVCRPAPLGGGWHTRRRWAERRGRDGKAVGRRYRQPVGRPASGEVGCSSRAASQRRGGVAGQRHMPPGPLDSGAVSSPPER
jgi:hypothetical protein